MAARPRGGRQSRWGDGRSAAAGLAPWSEYDDAHNDVDEADPRLRDDHNPLRRRSDRVEAWLLPAVLAAFLVLAPLVAAATIWQVHAANAADTTAQQSLHPAPAVLLAAAPGPMHRHGSSWLVWTPARWTAGGVTRTGQIPVGAGTPAGSRVRVWLTRSGQVRLPPLTPGLARDRGLFAAALALAALALRAGAGRPGRPVAAEPAPAVRLGRRLARGRAAVEPFGITGLGPGAAGLAQPRVKTA